MPWASVSVADTSKGSTNKVTQTDEHLYLPYPCSDSTDCTNYIVTLDPGEYGLETWGAQGGNDTSYPTTVFGGRGGYSKGTVRLRTRTTLYVYVGGSGTGKLSGSDFGFAPVIVCTFCVPFSAVIPTSFLLMNALTCS